MGPGGASRRSSAAYIGGIPIPAAAIKKDETQTGGASVDAPGFAASKPLTVARQELLPLAPLQRVTPYDKRNIAEFLTFVEAISLMLAAKDMHLAIQADPWLTLDEISPSFQRLGFDPLLRGIQALDADISELQRQLGPGAVMAATPVDAAKRSIGFAGLSFQIRRSPKPAKETPKQAGLREKKAQKEQLAAQLEAFEPAVEDVVFHFASQRQIGPRAPGAAAQAYEPPEKIASRLAGTMRAGDVKLMRAGLREFLSLPQRLMPNARKLALLRELLTFYGKFRGLESESSALWRYETTIACVDEIVSSEYLSEPERSEFCHKLERIQQDGPAIERDLFGFALFHRNHAIAAAILLGIHESSAEPKLKESLLAGIARSWGGLDHCVDFVMELLRPADRGLDWFREVIEHLESIKRAPPTPLETKS